jgi:glutamate-1-semialdehyde 2,1-aminomutase
MPEKLSVEQSNILNEGYGPDKLHARRAFGCFIEDENGRCVLDMCLGSGTHILGHAHPLVVDAINKQAQKGIHFIMPNRIVYEVGELMSVCIPHFSHFVFCNSGTEATMRAGRIARAITGRKKIAMFSGGWHGGNDTLLFEDDYETPLDRPQPMFKSAGLPGELMDLMVFLPYNHEAAFELIEEQRKDLAMVIVEPAQGSNPRDDVGHFLERLRQITDKYGILLCLDEIISGFRIGLGGCQEFYNIQGDLATYGKLLGGGLPIGVVAGRREVMEAVRGNEFRKPTFMGGTFSANPLVMNVAEHLLTYLLEHKNEVYPYLNEKGKHLREEMNRFCIDSDLPVRMIGIGSISRLIFTDKPIRSRRERDRFECPPDVQDRFFEYLLLEEGIHISGSRGVFLSMAHQKEHIQQFLQAVFQALERFQTELKKCH